MEPPDMFPDVTFENIDDLLEEFAQDAASAGGVEVIGDAAAYALVWEWGNRRQKKKGPRTVQGVNPAGESVWLSSQAPFGYIRINEPHLNQITDDVLSEVTFEGQTQAAIKAELTASVNKISKAFAEVIADSAPVDSGLLRESIKPIPAGDTILNQETDDYETLDL